MNEKKKGPLFHIVKRPEISLKQAILIRVAAILISVAICAVVIFLLTGDDPVSVFKTIWEGSFGSERRLWVLLQNVSILLIISLAMAPAFRMRFWNIGGEGQVMISVLAASSCMIMLGGRIPNWLVIVIEIIAAIAAGAIWAAIPAFFKSRWNTNETLFTLMMNYVATQLVAYFIIIWESPRGSGKIGIINQQTQAGWLPQIGEYKYLLTVIVAAVLTVFLHIYMTKSKHGYELRDLRNRRTSDGRKYGSYHDDNPCGRTRIHGGSGCLDGEVQPHRHDLHFVPAGLPGQGRRRGCDQVRPEPEFLGHSQLDHHLLPDRLRVLHPVQDSAQKGGEVSHV